MLKLLRSSELKKKLSLLVMTCILPIIIFLNILNLIFTDSVSQSQTQTTLDSYSYIQSSLDNQMATVHDYISLLYTSNYNLNTLKSENFNNRFYTKVSLFQQISREISFLQGIDYLFIYSPEFDELLLANANSSSSYAENQDIKKFIPNLASDNSVFQDYMWSICEIDHTSYLAYYQSYQETYIGCFIDLSKLLQNHLNTIEAPGLTLTITDHTFEHCISTYDFSKEDLQNLTYDTATYHRVSNHLVSGYPSEIANIVLWISLPKEYYFQGITSLHLLFFILSFSSLLIIAFFYRRLDTIIIQPLNSIKTAIREMRNNNYSYQIPEESYKTATYEFQDIFHTFNQMATEIGILKIRVLEEKISRQHIELNHYKMQLRPHTFINSLSTISQYAQSGNLEEMTRYINLFASHTRFLMSDALGTVSLKLEISQVQNYLQLQTLRLGQNLFYYIDCPIELYKCLIPRFVIYTFVENCIKHLGTRDHLTDILVSARMVQGSKILILTIEDNGTGFEEAYIQKINSGNSTEEFAKDGYHIGISNIIRILKLQYDNTASLEIGNSESGGAIVTIQIPFKEELLNECSNC